MSTGVAAMVRNRRVRWGLAIVVVALLLAFEVTVRHLPPDGITVTINTYSDFAVGNAIAPRDASGAYLVATTTRSTPGTSAQARAAIDRLNSALNTAPLSPLSYLAHCGDALGWEDVHVVFTWHGLPVQSWWSAHECPFFTEDSGGIPNLLWSRTLPPNSPDPLAGLR